MSVWYNTTPPSAGNNNSITNTATVFGIRDFLLNKNLIGNRRYPWLSTAINGSPKVGEPVLDTMVGDGSVQPTIPIEDSASDYYNSAVSTNLYKNQSEFNILNILYQPPSGDFFYDTTVPFGETQYPTTVPENWIYSLLNKTNEGNFLKKLVTKNVYLDESKLRDVSESLNTVPNNIQNQITNYIDSFGRLNTNQQGLITGLNVVGSILNGQGIGFTQNGLVTNFDVRSSIIGRTLGGIGVLNDTKLGLIGGQQLALSLANNAAFNLQQETLGKFNLNVINLLKGESFIRKNYRITIPGSRGGRIIDFSSRVLGFNIPISYLDNSASIFSDENGGIANIERANNMLDYTGGGQIDELLSLMNYNLKSNNKLKSGYAPAFNGHEKIYSTNPNLYAFYVQDKDGKYGIIQDLLSPIGDDVIPRINYQREKMVEGDGFNSYENGFGTSTLAGGISDFDIDFTWVSKNTKDGKKKTNANDNGIEFIGDKKNILTKTQLLFNSVGMKNIVSTKGDMSIGYPTQTQTSVVRGGISKGSAVLSSEALKGATLEADETFCRSWTAFDRYDSVQKLIRSRGLNERQSDGGKMLTPNNSATWRLNHENSVLDNNGFVKVSPYKEDFLTGQDPKKYMFSIENLAWNNYTTNLPEIEVGSGDPLSGAKGRIMWFPPYDLKITENGNANWETTTFIGRGEPVYTYNNTERSATISFKIIIDHPTVANAFSNPNGLSNEEITSFFAGCYDLDDSIIEKLTTEEKSFVESSDIFIPKPIFVEPETPPEKFSIYFENDRSTLPVSNDGKMYEDGVSGGLGTTNGEKIVSNIISTFRDQTNYGLNKKFIEYNNNPNDLKTAIDACPSCKVKLTGYASQTAASNKTGNNTIAKKRAENVKMWLVNTVGISANIITVTSKALTSGCLNPNEVDNDCIKVQRRVTIDFILEPAKLADANDSNTPKPNTRRRTLINEKIRNRYYNEMWFFNKLKQEDPFIFEKISDKIKYFSPGFHSTTPEGFNSRLTFLNQCLRQGPTQGLKSDGTANDKISNLAFGTPPVCILRIGDFFNTKIIIDSIVYDYEPMWDLNPEGVGVQPMIANVTMSFKIVGGSSLYGPINKLQNALSFNYYANTQVYDIRSDSYDVTTKVVNKKTTNEFNFKNGLDITKKSMKTETISINEDILSNEEIQDV